MPKISLKRRPDGRYACRYKEEWFYGKTSDEAIEARDEYKRQLKTGLKEETLGITVKQYALKWISIYKSGVGIRSYNDYAHYLNVMCEQFGSLRMREISASDIKQLYNGQSGKSGSHIRKFCMIINSMFSSAVDDGIIVRNPCTHIRRPDGEDGTHRVLEQWEIQLVVSMIGQHPFATAAMLMLYGGLRRGEVIAFNVDRDVDFINGIIHVKEAVAFDTNQPTVKGPKSKAGIREIPLFDPLRNALVGVHGLVVQRQTRRTETHSPQQYLSESAFSSLWASYKAALETKMNACHKRWYGKTKDQKIMLAKGGEVPPWKECTIRTHDFRHTFCTMLYNAGIDLKTTMKWMGHSDEKMILKVYAHLTAERELKAARFVGKLINESLCSQNSSHSDIGNN